MLTLFCAESSEKNILGWCTIFHELKSAVKAKIAQNNLFAGFLRRNYSQTRKRFHSWIDYLKSESICPFCNLYLVSNCIQGLVNFWLQLFSIQWDGKYFNGWNCYLQHSSNSRKLSRLKFHNKLVSLFTAPCPSKNSDWNNNKWLHFGQSEQCKLSILFSYPIRKESRFWLSWMWSGKDNFCIMPSFQKQITKMKGGGMIAG